MCDKCNVLNINGMNCHESGCPNAHDISCGGCGNPVHNKNIYTANDWDGIEYCKECAEYAAKHEAEEGS